MTFNCTHDKIQIHLGWKLRRGRGTLFQGRSCSLTIVFCLCVSSSLRLSKKGRTDIYFFKSRKWNLRLILFFFIAHLLNNSKYPSVHKKRKFLGCSSRETAETFGEEFFYHIVYNLNSVSHLKNTLYVYFHLKVNICVLYFAV